MNLVDQFSSELSALCASLEVSAPSSDTPQYVDFCKQLWSLVYYPYTAEEKREITEALRSQLAGLAARSQRLAQRIESALELRWARSLLERDIPLSVNFLLANKDDNSPRRSAFEALLHGYPMAWALPRYTAELELLRAVSTPSDTGRVIVIGSSAIPFTAVYFQTLAGINVTYLDPNPESVSLGREFISRLESIGILAHHSVTIESVSPTRPLASLPVCDAVFIVDQSTPHLHWLTELARLNTPLIFCQDAVGLASIVYQPIIMDDIPAPYALAGRTVPAHSLFEHRDDVFQLPIHSPDVFLTTAAFRAKLA